MSKPHFDNVLFQLSDEKQAQLYDWIQTLGYSRTIEKVAAPPPDGFNLKTYRASLHRFYVRYSLNTAQRDSEIASELSESASSTPVIRQGTEQAVQQSAFQLATSPHTTEDFNQLSRWITKLKAHEVKTQYLEVAKQHLALAEKRLELDRERFELNAARLALKHFLQLQKIYETEAQPSHSGLKLGQKP